MPTMHNPMGWVLTEAQRHRLVEIARRHDCLLIEDATASYFPAFKEASLAMIRSQGGIVGWTAPFAALKREA